MSDLRAVNVRLRQVVADKDELIASLERLLAAQRERSQIQDALVDGQAEQIRLQAEQIETQAQLIRGLQDEVAELKRRLGMDSSNSSTPPSKDSIAVKARRRADRSSRQRSAQRKPSGQPGHAGAGLSPTPDPDRTERMAAPTRCRQCRAGLDGAAVLADGWAQVWDLLPVVLAKTHYVLPRRRCGCGAVTTAAVPFGQAGTVCYGPNLNAAAVLLASEGNVPVERTAMLLDALFGVDVSAGCVLRCHPWAIALMESRTTPGPATLRHHDAIIATLRGAGFSVEMTAHAYALLDSYVYGFALQEAALPFKDPDTVADVAEPIMQHFSADQYPHLVEMATGYILRPGYDFGNEFEFGLNLILDALTRMIPDNNSNLPS